MSRSDLYVIDRNYEYPKFIPWDGTIFIQGQVGGGSGVGQIPLPSLPPNDTTPPIPTPTLPPGGSTTPPTNTPVTPSYPIAISRQSIDDWVDKWSEAFWATEWLDNTTKQTLPSPLQEIRTEISELPREIGQEISVGLGQNIGEQIAAALGQNIGEQIATALGQNIGQEISDAIKPTLTQINDTVPAIGSQVASVIAPEIAALTEAIQELAGTVSEGFQNIEQKFTSGINLSEKTIAKLGEAVKRPSMEFRARAINITNQSWTSPPGLQALAISNRGTVPGTFTDIDEKSAAKPVSLAPRSTWAWTVSEDIDKIAPVTVDAAGTTITASWLQAILPINIPST